MKNNMYSQVSSSPGFLNTYVYTSSFISPAIMNSSHLLASIIILAVYRLTSRLSPTFYSKLLQQA